MKVNMTHVLIRRKRPRQAQGQCYVYPLSNRGRDRSDLSPSQGTSRVAREHQKLEKTGGILPYRLQGEPSLQEM